MQSAEMQSPGAQSSETQSIASPMFVVKVKFNKLVGKVKGNESRIASKQLVKYVLVEIRPHSLLSFRV